MPEPVSRTVLFDPGVYSEQALDVSKLEYLDDIVISHAHPDHCSLDLLMQLTAAFPDVSITAPAEVVTELTEQGIPNVAVTPPKGITLFNSPHESVAPLFPLPEQIGVHYIDTLTHPGDSHSFSETKTILALPVAGPWASTIRAINLAIELKPKYVLPIHDWHWSDEAREQLYANIAKALQDEGIHFVPLVTGEPVVIDV